MKIEKLNFNEQQHKLFIEFLVQKYRGVFLNDYLTAEELLAHLRDNVEHSFIVFVDDKPYGAIWASPDAFNMFQICAATDNEHNFFTNKKILKVFVKYMFEVVKADKLKAEILVYNTPAEFTVRGCGFKKEGILIGETRIKGKPLNMLSLGLLREHYEKGIKIEREDLRSILGKIRLQTGGKNGKN